MCGKSLALSFFQRHGLPGENPGLLRLKHKCHYKMCRTLWPQTTESDRLLHIADFESGILNGNCIPIYDNSLGSSMTSQFWWEMQTWDAVNFCFGPCSSQWHALTATNVRNQTYINCLLRFIQPHCNCYDTDCCHPILVFWLQNCFKKKCDHESQQQF